MDGIADCVSVFACEWRGCVSLVCDYTVSFKTIFALTVLRCFNVRLSTDENPSAWLSRIVHLTHMWMSVWLSKIVHLAHMWMSSVWLQMTGAVPDSRLAQVRNQIKAHSDFSSELRRIDRKQHPNEA